MDVKLEVENKMKRLKIFCEGITDQVFIADCLEKFYNIKINKKVNSKDSNKWDISFGEHCEIVELGGCSKLSDKFYQDMFKDNSEEGGLNIIIFDADFSPEAEGEKRGTGNNGFENATKKLENFKKQFAFDFYLWPNNKIDGEVENLLRKLIPNSKEGVIKCIESHQNCLKQSQIENLKIADLKDQVGYYLHTVSKKSLPRFRDYKDNEFWDLSPAICDDLNTFKNFLDKYFVTN